MNTQQDDQKVDYSIVIPVYCNYGSLKKTYTKLQQEVFQKNPGRSFEVIFINDGSLDRSLEEIREIKEANPLHVKVIEFTRNFGQASAIRAGYEYAKGRCLINISADLQDPPELINEFINHHFNDGYEIVIGTREEREESWGRRATSKFFYSLIKKLSFKNMPLGGFDFALISDKVKDLMLRNNESNPFWQGQILWTGFKIKFISYKRKKREVGVSQWSFSKKIKYLIDGVLSYSYFPLRIMSILGLTISILGFLYAVVIFFARIFNKIPVEGWAPMMIIVLVLSGIQMLMLGIIGEYLWRTLDQVRKREPYVILKVY